MPSSIPYTESEALIDGLSDDVEAYATVGSYFFWVRVYDDVVNTGCLRWECQWENEDDIDATGEEDGLVEADTYEELVEQLAFRLAKRCEWFQLKDQHRARYRKWLDEARAFPYPDDNVPIG